MKPNELPDYPTLLARLVGAVREHILPRSPQPPLLIGIQTGGLWVAADLAHKLGLDAAIGRLDIGFYRDDYQHAGLAPALLPSALPWPIDDRQLLLVDDVLNTGRTVRAALNEIFDFGRPAAIALAVLISRDGRELPIQADAVGLQITLPAHTTVKLRGPAPLHLDYQVARQTRNCEHG
ncbi:MAG: bifunctional pyr operon transcriptional regulator/uracil phosphoribosyltransferase PyrR [Lysobacterales bacterium CG02_land_8_20_14_3_00_62_12]|nr:MAG: bifunctional pyr operon transcriptional regulator/uracil phosphoribosyltransferase PyrR [Xanthomonadales bacterium CG02_land_8_20_14_3_00_62_12]PJA37360.1 MAG: bifunctional pyr operon transcriptional regulator/uracil phosphoribosyltransferase PyrR [Xanthomonadales bacterium CG_4_9_14_3_um_filter_62_6]